MAVWRRVAQKARKKEEQRRREKQRRKRWRRWRENGGGRGCEAAVKRGRVRVGPSQLAGRVDADRESEGMGGRKRVKRTRQETARGRRGIGGGKG